MEKLTIHSRSSESKRRALLVSYRTIIRFVRVVQLTLIYWQSNHVHSKKSYCSCRYKINLVSRSEEVRNIN